MTKTLALLLDSYRELNAKRLFWIVLVVSGLVVAAFASIGIKGDTITFLIWKTPFQSNLLEYLDPALLYKSMFTYFGVGFWLTWLANILALVSTAGIFPDFMAGGSIDLYLSKPISRIRLFVTKYVGGLLFVTLQVTVFSLCSFLLLGTRGHSWEPKIFLSIPLVVMVFSYLFSICVLLGVLTRSTIASLLVTMLVWFALWGIQSAETILLHESLRATFEAQSLDRQIAKAMHDLNSFATTGPTTAPAGATSGPSLTEVFSFGFFSHHTPSHESRSELESRLEQLKTERSQLTSTVHTAHSISLAALTILPKTQGTTELLTRALLEKKPGDQDDDAQAPPDFSHRRRMDPDARAEQDFLQKEMQKVKDKRSATWILGTSLTFEAVILGLAGWLFCRRDY
jgi:hypothetical protein